MFPTSVNVLSINHTHGATRKIAFGQQPTTTQTGNAITPSPTVIIQDQFNNTVSSSGAQVTLAIGNNAAGNGVLNGNKIIAAVNGVATFPGLSIDAAGTGYTLVATSGTFTAVTSNAFNINSKVPTLNAPAACITEGEGNTTITLSGTNFEKNSIVQVNGSNRATTFISATQLQVLLPSSDLAVAGNLTLRVLNPAPPASNFSNTQTLTIRPELKEGDITGPASVCAGTSATFTAPVGYTGYEWSISNDDGSIVSGQGTNTVTINFADAASGQVDIDLEATNSCDKDSDIEFLVYVKPKPVLQVNASDPEICVGESVDLSVTGADSYVWSGNGIAAGTTGASINVSPTVTTTYTVTGTTNGCESDATTVTVIVNDLPVVSIGTLNVEYCSSDEAIPLTGSPSGGSFRILQGSTEMATGASFDPSVLGAGNYTIEYTYTDAKSCSNITTKAVTIKQQPTVTVTNDLEICIGASATLTATGADSYTWSPTAGLSATTGASVTANPTQTTTYTVIGTTDGCQSEAKTVTITVNELPDANITVRGPSVFCPENYVDLVAVSNPDYAYQWFRLNSNGSSTPVTASSEGPHVYSATTTGSYYVRITSDKGCVQSSEPITVQVANVPNTATIGIVGSTTFCDGGSVRFNANQSPTSEPYSYQWQLSSTGNENDFTDITGAESSSYTATTPGYYRVLVSNTAESTPEVEKCTKISVPVEVTVLPQPTAQILGGNQSLCRDPSGVTSFFLEGEYANGEYEWHSNRSNWTVVDLGNSEPGKTLVRVDVSEVSQSESATITLMSRNPLSSCNKALNSVTLSIKAIPITTITANRSTTLCRGEALTLTAGPNTGNYLWNTGATTRSITVSEPGEYTVTVTNSNGCAITSEPTTVIVNELPVVTIDTPLNDVYCKSEEVVQLTGSPANGTFRILRGTTVVNADATELDPRALASGTYIIEYSFTDGNTCTNKATKTVTINALPTVTIVEPSKAAYCTSEPVFNLSGNHAGGTFTINGQSATTFNAATLGAGTHTIIYTYTDGNGCTNNATKEVTINPLPTASINYTGPTTFCQGGSLVLTGVSDTGTSFTWFRNNLQVATGATYIATTTGSYTVRATNTNTCTSEMSAAVAVTVNPTITGNSISGTQTVCSGATIAPLVQASGTTLAGGATPYSYQWQSSPDNSTWTNITTNGTSATYTPPVQNVTSQTVTYYRRIVTGGGCSNTSTQNISVTINPNPTINGFSLGTDSDSDGDGKFADVYSGQGNITLTGNPTGGTFSGTGVSGTTFNPCTAGPGTHTITYTRISGTSPNQCTNVVTKTVTVRQSTYRAVIIANPHPFCRGMQVTYTTTIYRDLEEGDVIYPYLVDANGQPVYSNGSAVPTGSSSFPEANMAYPFPPNTPQSIKNLAYRFFQPIVKPGLESKVVTVVDNGDVYQWGKNHEVNRKNDKYYTTDAGLSSQDYYHVYVKLPQCLGITNLQSNRMYSAELPGYEASLTAVPNPICQNGSVTFTATLNSAFDWATANTTVEFVLSRGDVVLGSQPFNGTYTYTITSSGPAGGFVNGDQVYLRFMTDIENHQINKCRDNNRSNTVTINVVLPQAMTGGGVYCAGGAGVPVGLASSQQGVSYQLLRDGNPVGSPVAGTGSAISFGNQTVAGAYTVRPITASGSTCTDFGTINVYVTPLPTAFIVTGGGEYCATAGAVGVPIGLSGSQTGVSYQLLLNNVANGSPVNGTGAALNFGNKTAAGTYTVRATTISNNTSTPPVAACPQLMTGSVAIIANPLPTVTVNSPTVCAGQSATITAVPAGGTGPYTYTWTVPGGVTDPGSVASFQTTVAGTYTVRVTDSKSCVSSAAATSTVTLNPLPTVTVNSPTTCQGTTTTVAATVANGTGPYTYAWTVPGGVTDPGSVASFQTGIAGNYSVIVTDSKGCASVSGSGTVTVTPTKVATGVITAENASGPISETNPIMRNEPVTFTVNTDIAAADVRLYSWYVGSEATGEWGSGPMASGTTNSFTMTPTTNDPFDVKVEIATAAEACYSFTTFFTDDPIVPLPVELIYFNAERRENTVVLTWATAMEKNNEGFEVQVSQDGKNYRQLQFVPTQNGNTSVKQTYQFVDKENGKYGTRYYRLKQLDSDGKFTYYGPEKVQFGEVGNKVLVYPNPFEREVKLDIDAEKEATMELTVTNIMGRQLMSKTVDIAQGKNTVTLDLGADLPAGVYIITTRFNGLTSNFKLLKQ